MTEIDRHIAVIDADISALQGKLVQAKREANSTAGEMEKAFTGVGKALDLSRFRRELAQTERVTKQAAERMKQTLAKVGKLPKNPSAKSGQSPSSSGGQQSITFSLDKAIKGAGIGGLLVTIAAATFTLPISAGAIVAFLGASTAIGGFSPNLERMLSGRSGSPTTRRQSIEEIEKRIEELEEPVKGPPQFRRSREFQRKGQLEQARRELARAAAELAIDIENEFASAFENNFGSANTEFLDKFNRLSDCLQRLCDRLDELRLQGSGGSADLTGGAGNDTLSGGAGRDGRLIPASFGNTGLGELNRKLAESAWRVQDLSTGFQEAGDAAEDYGSETRTLNGLLGEGNKIFTEQTGLIGALRQQLPGLGGDFVKVFDETTEQGRELNSVIDELGTSLFDAFSDGVFKGKELSGVLKELAEDVLRILKNAAQSGGLGGGSGGGGSFLSSLFGSLIGGGGGGAFTGGGVAPSVGTSSFGIGGAQIISLAHGGGLRENQLALVGEAVLCVSATLCPQFSDTNYRQG